MDGYSEELTSHDKPTTKILVSFYIRGGGELPAPVPLDMAPSQQLDSCPKCDPGRSLLGDWNCYNLIRNFNAMTPIPKALVTGVSEPSNWL